MHCPLVSRVYSHQDVEANPSTVFQSVRGSKQYWYLRRSNVLCMVREYGSPTLFLTLSCAEYESHEISNYLRKVNSVSDSYPIGKLCTEDLVYVLRKFSQKFHDFSDTVILNGGVLGPVAHYLFLTRKSCQEFNSKMLSRLEAEVKEIPCIDEVDETSGTFKWSEKATEEMKKLNRDCNLIARLEAVFRLLLEHVSCSVET